MRLNFRNKEAFEWRYKRPAKEWTLKSIHNLYLQALNRHQNRMIELRKVTNRIIHEIPEYEKDRRRIYFIKDDKIFQRDFSYHREWDSWGTSTERLKFDGSVSQNRNDKIEFLLSKEKEFELGELYEKSNSSKWMHLRIREALQNAVCEELRKKFKNDSAPDMFTINIDGYQYYVTCDDQYNNRNNYYKKFELRGRVTINTIVL